MIAIITIIVNIVVSWPCIIVVVVVIITVRAIILLPITTSWIAITHRIAIVGIVINVLFWISLRYS